jgi:hypothetical protein
MMLPSERRWMAIRASVLLAICGSLFPLLWGVFILVDAFESHPAKFWFLLLCGAGLLGLFAWDIATVVGILRRRPWARISILILAALLAAGSIKTAVEIFLWDDSIIPKDAEFTSRQLKVAGAGPYLMTAALGVWWLYLFSAARTRQYFNATPTRPKRRATGGLRLIPKDRPE